MLPNVTQCSGHFIMISLQISNIGQVVAGLRGVSADLADVSTESVSVQVLSTKSKLLVPVETGALKRTIKPLKNLLHYGSSRVDYARAVDEFSDFIDQAIKQSETELIRANEAHAETIISKHGF